MGTEVHTVVTCYPLVMRRGNRYLIFKTKYDTFFQFSSCNDGCSGALRIERHASMFVSSRGEEEDLEKRDKRRGRWSKEERRKRLEGVSTDTFRDILLEHAGEWAMAPARDSTIRRQEGGGIIYRWAGTYANRLVLYHMSMNRR
jgi:hypothetical protein